MSSNDVVHSEIDHDAVERVLRYWIARYGDVVGKYPVSDGGEYGAFMSIAQEIGFSETRRVINYYLQVSKDPSFLDFLNKWSRYQEVAHDTKHDRMYRQPDPRLDNGNSEE